MIPILYPSTETSFTTNGLGGLPDAISCVVTEQRNTQGGYFLEMEYPIDGLHFDLLAPERIIYAAPSMGKTPQPFRISRITRPINGIVHIEAPHLCAELQKLTSWGIDTGTNIQGMIYNQFYRARQLGQTVPFWCETDITVESDVTFSHPEPTSLADILLGAEGSVLDVVGGEYEWDGYHILLHRQRGVDSGLEIRYGVNMSDLEAETDATELVTACVPFWKGTVNEQDVVVMGDMCTADNASAYAYVRCVPLDVSQQFELEQDEQPTAAQVTAKGQAFINSTSRKLLQTSIRVSYEPTTSGIGERLINLCDTVRVVYPDLNVSSISKVVETKFNVLIERYDELTIGTIRNNIVDTIAGLISGGAVSYSGGGSGSGGGGSSVGAVLYNMPQNLNEAQKAQARSNIGVGSGGDVEVNFPVYTPQDFGAVGDASADDTSAFNDAIEATGSGGTVFVPDGRYILSDTIRIPEWKMLVLSGAVELLFLNIDVNDPCIKISRYGRLKGNGSLVIVPYNYMGHAVELSMTEELTNVEENSTKPFYNTPGWRLMRNVEGIGIMKRRGTSASGSEGYDQAFKQTRVKDLANIGGDGIYIGVDADFTSSLPGCQWMTKVDAMIGGGFANGFHLEVVQGTGRWMSDTYISGAVEGAETGVLIERATGGVYCDVIVQPSTSLDGSGIQHKYAKNGIKVISSPNVDMSRSKIWDWNSDNTLVGTLVDGEDIYRAYALVGGCRGATIHDFGMNDSQLPFHDRIYTNGIGNLLSATIIGAKGILLTPPKYAFYKNYRRHNATYDYLNVSWRDPQNMLRFQMPFLPSFPGDYPNRLYKLGYFDFDDAEVPQSGFNDVLPRQTITIEENDNRGLYGYTNLFFDTTTAEARWNPVGYGTGGHIPIYYYSQDGTRRYIYRLVRDNTDIQQIYNCQLYITNARRFVFDFLNVGEISSLSAETYKLIQPQIENAELYLAGSVTVQNGVPMICTQSAVFGRNGTPTTPATVKRLVVDEGAYQMLDYIESDGASFIDTGIAPTANTKISARFKHASSTTINSAERQYVFGTFSSVNGTYESRLQFYYGGSQLVDNSNFFIGWGTGNGWTSADDTNAGYRYFNITPDATEHSASFAQGDFGFDGVHRTTLTNSVFTTPKSIYLFACNEDGTVGHYSKGLQIEAVSIYDGNTRIARFVPCLRRADSALGMFDEDSETFFENQGFGSFKNENVTPQEQSAFPVTLNADGTVNTFDSNLTYSAAASSVQNGKPKKLIVTWGNSIFTADADEKLPGANGDVKFITDCEHDGIQRHIIFTLTSANALQTTLIETYSRVPATVWEVSDVTQGLIALNANISSSLAWQLTGLNLSPFKRIKVYAKAGRKTGTAAADSSIVPAAIIEMLLDDRAKETVSQNVFIGSAVVQNPNDANRLGILTCAVSGDKTKFAVVRATSLYGTSATSNTDCYQYVFKIEGYYD